MEEIGTAGARLETLLGIGPGGIEDVPGARTTVQFFPVGESRLEIIAPMGEDSPVARHLQKRGPGVHHLCLEVDDLEDEVARLREAGMRFVTDEIQQGAHGARIIFLHPKSTGGVLIELQQSADP